MKKMSYFSFTTFVIYAIILTFVLKKLISR